MTNEIKDLSEKLAKLYGVEALQTKSYNNDSVRVSKWLAEDSGRISDLADENGVDTLHCFDRVQTQVFEKIDAKYIALEFYDDHPSKSAAARMARVRCLLAIKGVKE